MFLSFFSLKDLQLGAINDADKKKKLVSSLFDDFFYELCEETQSQLYVDDFRKKYKPRCEKPRKDSNFREQSYLNRTYLKDIFWSGFSESSYKTITCIILVTIKNSIINTTFVMTDSRGRKGLRSFCYRSNQFCEPNYFTKIVKLTLKTSNTYKINK